MFIALILDLERATLEVCNSLVDIINCILIDLSNGLAVMPNKACGGGIEKSDWIAFRYVVKFKRVYGGEIRIPFNLGAVRLTLDCFLIPISVTTDFEFLG